jgi:hypothetical protein
MVNTLNLKEQIKMIFNKYPESQNNDRLSDYYLLKDIYGVTLPKIYLNLPSFKQMLYIKEKALKENNKDKEM